MENVCITTNGKYLVHLLDEWIDFRYAELFALLELCRLNPQEVIYWKTIEQSGGFEFRKFEGSAEEFVTFTASKRQHASNSRNGVDHFIVLNVPSIDIIKFICSRAILIKAVYELWTFSTDLTSLIAQTKNLDSVTLNALTESTNTWSLSVTSFGKTLTNQEKEEIRNNFRFLDMKGRVSITSPEIDLHVVLDNSLFMTNVDNLAHTIAFYFGRKVCDGGMKEELKKYSLKKRSYLGPTSLDDMLAFILANLALVQPGYILYEPFVGTGSIVVALHHLKALAIGSDIDPRVLRGDMYAGSDQPTKQQKQQQYKQRKEENTTSQGKKRDVLSNFEEYNLALPELVRLDVHLFDRHFTFSDVNHDLTTGFFDAIVTDPPYGIRAGARKTGSKEEVDYTLTEEKRSDYVPKTQPYAVEEVMLDLLHLAARSLTMNARLVYLIPTTYDFTVDDLPKHPCLAIHEICHQHLSMRHGRRAVVMVKIKEYGASEIEQFLKYKNEVLSGIDQGFGQLKTKLAAALAGDAFENEAVVKVKSHASEKRRIGKMKRKEYSIQQREKALVSTSEEDITADKMIIEDTKK